MFRAAVDAVDPARLVAAHLGRDGGETIVHLDTTVVDRWVGPTLIVGGGKAAARMAAGCESAIGSRDVSGAVVVADGCGVPLQAIEVIEAGHPLPDARGEHGARKLLNLVTQSA